MKTSAGILAYRFAPELQVFLVHPGGPFFKSKDAGVWTIPKGEFGDDEVPLIAAQREFAEETGHVLNGTFVELLPIKQKGGKQVLAWCVAQEIDESRIISNTFSLEWPPRSGRSQSFPEIDKAEWFRVAVAKEKINPAQISFIDQLMHHLAQVQE